MDAGDIGDSGGALVTSGWSLDLEAALQDIRKSRKNRKNRHSAIFFAFAADDFFFILHCKKPRQTSLDLEARRKLSTPHSTPPASLCRLAGSLTTHKKQGCDCLLDCDALF